MSPDETLLIRWTARRDAEAFNEIVERFSGQVYATCRRILGNDADAEEVAQECFLLLIRSGETVHSSLGGWLHGIATNKSKERIRLDANRRTREHAFGDNTAQVTESGWDDIQQHVDSALETLPSKTRDMLVAHFIGRKTHEEIATEAQLGRRAVSYRIQRGLASVRRELDRRGVVISSAAIASFFASNSFAAPLSLKASLGKLAIAAGTTPAVVGTTTTNTVFGSLLVMKTKTAIVCAVTCLIVAGLASLMINQTGTNPTPPPTDTTEVREPTASIAATPEVPAPIEEAIPVADTVEQPNERPTLEDLIANSRAELEDILKWYPPIVDSEEFATISGTVVDRDGYAIPEAFVQVLPASNWGLLPRTDTFSHTISSDPDGTYTIEGIDHEGIFWVSASKPGYADGARGSSVDKTIQIGAGTKATGIDFILTPGPSIRGRLLTLSGTPVSDGIVQCLGIAGPNSMSVSEAFSARTDAEGYFSMGFQEENRGKVSSLRARSAKHGATTFPGIRIQEDELIELRLSAPAIIHGTVRFSDEKPAPKARLNFYGRKKVAVPHPGTGAPWEPTAFAGRFFAVCDDEGRYAVEVDAGLDYEAEVLRGDAAWNINTDRDEIAALKSGEHHQYDAVLDANVITVHGSIVGSTTGEPFNSFMGHAQIFAHAEKNRLVGIGSMERDGRYELIVPGDPGVYTFVATYIFMFPPYLGEVSAPQTLEGGDILELELAVPEPQYFSVRAVDAAGNPIAGVSVTGLTENNNTVNANDRLTNEEGRLDGTFAMPPNSGSRLVLAKSGYATTRTTVHENQRPATRHPEEVVVLREGAGFEGDLVNADGHPLPETALSITITNPDGQSWSIQITTDENGHFTVVDQAPADVVNITITTKGLATASWSAEQLQLEAGVITWLGAVSVISLN
jgi:RNA polymerase sigma factor (sigma-70 family)